MSKRHRQILERLKAQRERAIIRYVYGKQIDQRVRAAREQAINRYGYGRC